MSWIHNKGGDLHHAFMGGFTLMSSRGQYHTLAHPSRAVSEIFAEVHPIAQQLTPVTTWPSDYIIIVTCLRHSWRIVEHKGEIDSRDTGDRSRLLRPRSCGSSVSPPAPPDKSTHPATPTPPTPPTKAQAGVEGIKKCSFWGKRRVEGA